eukprot:gene17919-biopygen37872
MVAVVSESFESCSELPKQLTRGLTVIVNEIDEDGDLLVDVQSWEQYQWVSKADAGKLRSVEREVSWVHPVTSLRARLSYRTALRRPPGSPAQHRNSPDRNGPSPRRERPGQASSRLRAVPRCRSRRPARCAGQGCRVRQVRQSAKAASPPSPPDDSPPSPPSPPESPPESA